MGYLITGHRGFIGKNLTNFLDKKDVFWAGIDRPMDVCNIVTFHDIMNHAGDDISTIVHLAARVDVRESIKYPVSVFMDNCRSTITALECAKEYKLKFIFISSQGAQDCLSSYTASKRAGEALCKSYHESYGIDVSVLRPSNVYGPYSDHKQSVIARFIRQMIEKKALTIYGDGNQVRDFIYVGDVVKAIVECRSQFQMVSTGVLTSINTLVSKLDYDKVIYLEPTNGEALEVETTYWDGCEVSLEDGLKSTLEWFESKLNYLIN